MQENTVFIALVIQMIAVVAIALNAKPDSHAMLEWFKGL